MARITPPYGYTWNEYIELQVSGVTDPAERRLIKRDLKLSIIAAEERYAGGDTASPSYRDYHIYESPGTVAPTVARPWLTEATDHLAQILTEDGNNLGTQDGNELIAE